jgi:UDP-N-acetylglucosamine--N-acetylmuramyl-(pentapeptide) pyrophosphoryl-undecaprenol N-acetylglucosamine transferase
VRPEFFAVHAPPENPPQLLVFGGSQGARIFNVHLPQIILALLDAVPALTVLHQSGARHVDSTLAVYAETGADPRRWQVRAFVEDMPAEFAKAHLVMARSGASTVAELAAAGKPSMLVPFAAAADEHQKRNAEGMVSAGAAVMLEEKDLEIPGKLLQTLTALLSDPARLAAMGNAARTQAHSGAAERIADRLATLASGELASR